MTISVIIPAVNESLCIVAAVQSARRGGASEIIVVDGGSKDETRELAAQNGARVISAERGRGLQMNRGAAEATGDVLLFLHADNRLTRKFATQINGVTATAGRRLGIFWQAIESRRVIYRLVESGNYWRVRLFNLAYGDQGIWMDRELFFELGGFPALPLMEDYCFSERLPKGLKYQILPGPLFISPRRWEQRGVWRQTWHNWGTVRRYRQGASMESLLQRYPGHDAMT